MCSRVGAVLESLSVGLKQPTCRLPPVVSKPTSDWGSSDGKVPLIAFLAFFFFYVFKLGSAPLVTQKPSDICRFPKQHRASPEAGLC